jgi:thioredoxin-like negative regulator of GroEL
MQEVAAIYNVQETPAVVYIKNGRRVHSIAGSQDMNALKQAIDLFAGEAGTQPTATAATTASRG